MTFYEDDLAEGKFSLLFTLGLGTDVVLFGFFKMRHPEQSLDEPKPYMSALPKAPTCAQCKESMRLERIEATITDHGAVVVFRCQYCRLSEAIPLP
jgi:hypothetical protein